MTSNDKQSAQRYVMIVQSSVDELDDPRVEGRTTHSLLNVIVIALLAVMCGAKDWEDIETYGMSRAAWLSGFLELSKKRKIPGHDTFRRVLSALNPKLFSEALFKLTKGLHEAVRGEVIAIDGKTLRGTCEKDGHGGLHLVTAWATEMSLTLGMVPCAEKSNEITAIPELLALLDIKGSTITIDAMGCQVAIAEQIRDQKGHYVLGLKGNQSGLERDMEQLALDAVANEFEGVKHTYHEDNSTGHGRIEERTCTAIEIPEDHPQRQRWPDLRTLVAIEKFCRKSDGTASREWRFYISSLPAKADKLAHAVRRHWTTENRQHWNLDVSFGEDTKRARDRNALTNLAAISRLTLSLLRQEASKKTSINRKRFMCGLDTSYLLKVLKCATF
jgi:predicted transposase YbfD/YdcC